MWHGICDRINANPAFDTLAGVYLILMYTPKWFPKVTGSTEEAWAEAMYLADEDVDARYFVEDTMHKTFRTVEVAPRRKDERLSTWMTPARINNINGTMGTSAAIAEMSETEARYIQDATARWQ